MGDPHGVGPEIVLKSLARMVPDSGFRPVLFGAPEFLKRLAADLGLAPALDVARIVPVADYPYPPRWGELDRKAGEFSIACLGEAVEFCRKGGAPLLVTAPINKAAAHLSGFRHPGQTEFVASFFPGVKPAMAFFSDRLNVVLATVHIPLREVFGQLSAARIVSTARLFHVALLRLGRPEPRLALCGLNPHASEGGLFGDEEERIVEPAARELGNLLGEGVVSGPHPPDTVFRRALAGEFDGVVALYHDQGLIPVKLVAFDSAVNSTLGLPIVRVSPDHGTAFDIAGQGVADCGSMLKAIEVGRRLAEGVEARPGQTDGGATRL